MSIKCFGYKVGRKKAAVSRTKKGSKNRHDHSFPTRAIDILQASTRLSVVPKASKIKQRSRTRLISNSGHALPKKSGRSFADLLAYMNIHEK